MNRNEKTMAEQTELCQCGHDVADHYAGTGHCMVRGTIQHCPRFTPPTESEKPEELSPDEREAKAAAILKAYQDTWSTVFIGKERLIVDGYEQMWNAARDFYTSQPDESLKEK